MIRTDDVGEFYRLNHQDIVNFIYRKLSHYIRYNQSIDDLTQSFYTHMVKNDLLKKYDPAFKTKFSTFIFRCLMNHCSSYHGRTRKDEFLYEKTCSIDTCYSDNTKNKNNNFDSFLNKIIIENDSVAARIDLQYIEEYIKKKENIRINQVRLSDVYNRFLKGMNDTEISKEEGISIAGIGSCKRRIVELIKRMEMI